MTQSFITAIPLKTSRKEQICVKKAFLACKTTIQHTTRCLNRLDTMRADKQFKQVIKIYNKKGKNTESNRLFKTLATAYNYSAYDLYAYTTPFNKKCNPLFIGARISQQLAKRVFGAVKAYQYKERSSPRCKGDRGINSLADNSLRCPPTFKR